MRVQRAQTRVKSLVVPHVKELARPISQILVVIFDRRAKGVFELGKVTINLHVLRSAGGQAAHAGHKLRGGRIAQQSEGNAKQDKNKWGRHSKGFHGPDSAKARTGVESKNARA